MNTLKKINTLNNDTLHFLNLKYLETLLDLINESSIELSSIKPNNFKIIENRNIAIVDSKIMIKYDDAPRIEILHFLKKIKNDIFLLKSDIPNYSTIDNKKDICDEYFIFHNNIISNLKKFNSFYKSYDTYLLKIIDKLGIYIRDKQNEYNVMVFNYNAHIQHFDDPNFCQKEKNLSEEIRIATHYNNIAVNYLNLKQKIREKFKNNNNEFLTTLKNTAYKKSTP